MRTTITLDPDVALLVEQEMEATDRKFKDVVNEALRNQLSPARVDLAFPVADLGQLKVEVANFNHLASELEDEHLLNKLREGR